MNERQRFLATMRYEPRDRSPICDFGFWNETFPVWKTQGLPDEVAWPGHEEFFGMDRYDAGLPVSSGLRPGFEWKTLEDRGDHEVVQDWNGVILLRKKFMGSIPIHLGHTLVDRESWKREFLPRLRPDDPERFGPGYREMLPVLRDPDGRSTVMNAHGGSLYGWIRDWMGVENVSMVVYDDPAWFEEMVETIADVVCAVLDRMAEDGVRIDAGTMWEDMCYSGGPLLSPTHFAKVLVPRYRRITERMRKLGAEIVWLDCDGKIDALIPLWLEAGVNCMFPIEVGTWGADPVRYRREYGRELRMMGGFDKHLLQASPEAISAEVERLAPLVEEGGYIPFCDHRVPPDVPYAHYLHYLSEARRVWGKNTNLKPCPALEQAPAAVG